MPSSSPSRTALDPPFLRVSKPITACSRCRRAKKKCDGKLPVCSACKKSGRAGECSMDNQKLSKGSERNYIASLESRIEELEKKISFAQARKASLQTHDIDEPISPLNQKDSFTAILKAVRGKEAQKREAEDLNELVSDFGFLSINATTRDFEAATTGMTFARIVLAATTNNITPEFLDSRLPPKVNVLVLISYYLQNIFPLFPISSEEEVLKIVDKLYQQHDSKVSEFEYWLFFMILAISSSSQSRGKSDKLYIDGVTWVRRALHYADRVLVPGYISQIQALVLLVEYSILDPAHFDSWNLIGFACRAVVDLGFHQDPPQKEDIDQDTMELRRSIFYCVYTLDRSISMVHARPFSFTDDSISVALPSIQCGSTLGMAKFPETALLLFRFRIIQSSWYQKIFQSSRDPLQTTETYISQVCKDMSGWVESIPDNLAVSFKDFFELELLYSYVYLFSPSCHLKSTSAYEKKIMFESSIRYILKISCINQFSTGIPFHTYHDSLRSFFVASHFVSILSENQNQLLSPTASFVPPAGKILLPPFSDAGINNIERSLECIFHIKQTLKSFANRWEETKRLLSLSSLEVQLGRLERDLHQRIAALALTQQNQNIDSFGRLSTPYLIQE